jgi:4-hydroxy-4-methyl-2-oxoglutarate aldolase
MSGETASTAQYCDADPRVAVLDPGIKRVASGMRLLGPAFTVECPAGDNLAIHRAVAAATTGDVLVVAVVGEGLFGAFGEILALNCLRKGLAGLVTDGGVRDIEEIAELGFPVFSRHVSPRGTIKQDPGRLQAPIRCGGVTIEPGDLIMADAVGAIAVPREACAALLEKVRAIMLRETGLVEAIRAGADTLALIDVRR